MRHVNLKEADAKREQRLLDEFRSAAFGDFCRSRAYTALDRGDDEPRQIWLEALQESSGQWVITHQEARLDPADKDATDFDIITTTPMNDGEEMPFYDVVKKMAEFEADCAWNGYVAADEDEGASLGDTYFRPFAVREAIAFDATTQMPVLTQQGRITSSGEFTVKMRRDVLAAWQEKSRVFRLPQFDIGKRLREVDEDIPAEELKKILQTKEKLPEYVRLFEHFVEAYRDAATDHFKWSHKCSEVDKAHDALEECIDSFPQGGFPAKEDLRMNAAKMYVYYTMQKLQAGYQRARKDSNDASQFIENTAMTDLKKLEGYYKDRTKSALPSASKLVRLIMDNDFRIEGTPPADIMENFSVLKQWQENLQTGLVLPEAKLPETLPLGEYIPLQFDASEIKKSIKSQKLAEQIVGISHHMDRFAGAYQQWLASECKDESLWNKMSRDDGLHDQLETAIVKLPYNDIVDRDKLVEACCRMWMGAEIWRLKALQGEDNEKVHERLNTIIGYHDRQLKLTKHARQTRQFKRDFTKEALGIITDNTKTLPKSLEPEYQQWQTALSEFTAGYRESGRMTPAAAPSPKP